MQPKLLQSASLDFRTWANWLGAIAKSPCRHGKLTQVGEQIQYITATEKKRLEKIGSRVHHLTLNKILEITQIFWRDKNVSLSSKKQMLHGLRCIHEKRKAKYNQLWWPIKWFARLRGVDIQLRTEAEAIERLNKELNTPKLINGKKIVKIQDKSLSQINTIQQQLKGLFDNKKNIKAKGLDDWYEQIFNLEKKLYSLKQTFSIAQLQAAKDQFKELERQLEENNSEMPRVKLLIKEFGDSCLKSTLEATLNALCSSVTAKERERDQTLFQLTGIQVLGLYAKRLIKAKRTDFSLSLITAIERTWQEIKDSQQKATTKIIEGKRVIFIPADKEVYLKEGFIKNGSYKAVFVLTSFHDIKKGSDRCKYVILQPLPAVEDEIDEASQKKDVSDSSSDSSESSPELKVQEDKESEEDEFNSNGFIVKSGSEKSANSLEKQKKSSASSNVVKNPAKKNNCKIKDKKNQDCKTIIELDSESLSDQIASAVSESDKKLAKKGKEVKVDKAKQFIPNKNHESAVKDKKAPKAPAKKAISSEDSKGYLKEAENCLLYGKLPGIWPTCKVVSIDEQIGIIQLTAGYPVKTTSGKRKIAVSLGDMSIFFKEKKLSKPDQLVFVNMIGSFLVGLDSFHSRGIIHRDMKPDNILCSRKGDAAVSDLGTVCANKISKKNAKGQVEWIQNPEKKGLIGTPYYISPEMVHYNIKDEWEKLDVNLDIWSVGLILWETLSGQPLLKHHAFDTSRNTPSGNRLVQKIGELFNGKYVYSVFYPEPKEETSLAHLIWHCTRIEPSERPSIKEVIQRYQAWAKYVTTQMNEGKIQSIDECFEHAVV